MKIYVTFGPNDVTYMKLLVIFDIIICPFNMYFCPSNKICFIH